MKVDERALDIAAGEIACRQGRKYLFEEDRVYAEAAISAYLTALAEKPVAWQQRHRFSSTGGWSDWYPATEEAYREHAERPSDRFQLRPLFASPQPVAVSEEIAEGLRAARWLCENINEFGQCIDNEGFDHADWAIRRAFEALAAEPAIRALSEERA